jgi:hypothetical protein
MRKFEFFFAVNVLHLIIDVFERLSASIQTPEMTMDVALATADMAITKLNALRNDEGYENFWISLEKKRDNAAVDEPKLPRKRKAPRRIEEGSQPVFHATPKDFFRPIFLETIDLSVMSLTERLNTDGVKLTQKVENLLILSSQLDKKAMELPPFISNLLHDICESYPKDFCESILSKELIMLSSNTGPMCSLMEIKKKMRDPFVAIQNFLPSVHELLRVSSLIPVTTATSERSLGGLKRIKSYLRTTMTQNRTCALLVLTTHRTLLDLVSDINIAQQFVNGKPHRKSVFGNFL